MRSMERLPQYFTLLRGKCSNPEGMDRMASNSGRTFRRKSARHLLPIQANQCCIILRRSARRRARLCVARILLRSACAS